MSKLFRIVLVFMTMISLTGCQLASEQEESTFDTDSNQINTDWLVGVLFTDHSIYDDYLVYKPDTLDFLTDETIKIYADIDDENKTIEIPEVEGMICIDFNSDTDCKYIEYEIIGVNFSNEKININNNDGAMLYSYELQAYCHAKDDESKICYVNPIYMDKNENIYVTPASGMTFDNELNNKWTISIWNDYSETINDETTATTIKFNVSIESIDPVDQWNLIYMNDAHQVVHEESYTIETMSETVSFAEGSTYLLVEGINEGEIVSREVYSKGVENQYITIYQATDSVICKTKSIDII